MKKPCVTPQSFEEKAMPKQIAQDELDDIVSVVARFPGGVPLGKITRHRIRSVEYETWHKTWH